MFCSNCGAKLPDNVRFCPNCGASTADETAQSVPQNDRQTPYEPQNEQTSYIPGNEQPPFEPHGSQFSRDPRGSQSTRNSQGLTGFSNQYKSPEFLAIEKKQKRAMPFIVLLLLLLPILGFSICGFATDQMEPTEGILVGLGVSAIFGFCFAFFALKKKKPVWEGVVTNKQVQEKQDYDRETGRRRYYNQFVLTFRTDTGKTERLVTSDRSGGRGSRMFFDILNVGDRVRYYPKYEYYEKYDKTRDTFIYCALCHMQNDIRNQNCEKCGAPLFK